MKRLFAILLLLAQALPQAGAAQQRDQTLADIRQELSVLYVAVQRLKRELSTTGAPATDVSGNTPLERIDAIETELQRLTSKSEELEYRLDQVVRIGSNQIGDLEFRLCELETACDVSALPEGTTLGNVDITNMSQFPGSDPGGAVTELAVGEQSDFDRAKTALDDGNLAEAAEQFVVFTQTYPGGPLSAEAFFLRGDALEKLGEIRQAARSYLDSFSIAPTGPMAPDALYKVGTTLGALGQTEDACQMLDQVEVRFPEANATLEARSAMRNLGCL
ncbi:MAG: tol-pal system protein YbgF [Halocynthiibacter sp.]